MPKVMLIEDDTLMVSLLQTLLSYEGFETAHLDEETSEEEVLRRIRQEQPQLILLDVHLRHLNGLELLGKLREDAELKAVRVLVSSGMEMSSQSHLNGADGFILKPYMPDELVARIRRLLSTDH